MRWRRARPRQLAALFEGLVAGHALHGQQRSVVGDRAVAVAVAGAAATMSSRLGESVGEIRVHVEIAARGRPAPRRRAGAPSRAASTSPRSSRSVGGIHGSPSWRRCPLRLRDASNSSSSTRNSPYSDSFRPGPHRQLADADVVGLRPGEVLQRRTPDRRGSMTRRSTWMPFVVTIAEDLWCRGRARDPPRGSEQNASITDPGFSPPRPAGRCRRPCRACAAAILRRSTRSTPRQLRRAGRPAPRRGPGRRPAGCGRRLPAIRRIARGQVAPRWLAPALQIAQPWSCRAASSSGIDEMPSSTYTW